MKTSLKYGKDEIKIEIPDSKVTGIYLPSEKEGLNDTYSEIKKAINKPIKSKKLSEIASEGKSVSIIVDDATRPIPTSEILLPLIDELNLHGINDSDITVVIAAGNHRNATETEKTTILGSLKNRIRIIDHNSENYNHLIFIGSTSKDNKIYVNKTAYESDIRIIICDVDFHFFCGYGGGAKSIFPGIAAKESAERNHSMMIHPSAKAGIIKGNPAREEIDEVGKMFRIDFQIAVVLNSNKEIVNVFAGDINETFLKGIEICDEMYKVIVPKRADIVIVSCGGYPLDIDLYQTQKSTENAIKVVKEGGKVIAVAECALGFGSDVFVEWMENARSIDEIFKNIENDFNIGGHKAFLFARQMKWADLFLYSVLHPDIVKEMFINPVNSVEDIISIIENFESVIILPEGNLTLPELSSS